jgi:hypothetical protein
VFPITTSNKETAMTATFAPVAPGRTPSSLEQYPDLRYAFEYLNLDPDRLDRITRRNSSFLNFGELINSCSTYRPTIYLDSWSKRHWAAAYDKVQKYYGDPRRAYKVHTKLTLAQAVRLLTRSGRRDFNAIASYLDIWVDDGVSLTADDVERWFNYVCRDSVSVKNLSTADSQVIVAYLPGRRDQRVLCKGWIDSVSRRLYTAA